MALASSIYTLSSSTESVHIHHIRKQRSTEKTLSGKSMVQQIQKGRKNYISIMVSKCRRMKNIEESFEDSGKLKGGYFSVVVQEDGKPKKLFISLRYLSYPPFLSLLDAAEKEFGFDQKGVLEIPCEARELRNILSGRSSIFKKEKTCKTCSFVTDVYEKRIARGVI